MKSKTATIYIILSLMLVSIFGFLGFGMMGDAGGVCSISTIVGGVCPNTIDSFSYAIHHIESLQSLLQANLSLNLILILISAFFSFYIFDILKLLPDKKPLFSKNYKPVDYFGISLRWQFLRWLSLQNKKGTHLPTI